MKLKLTRRYIFVVSSLGICEIAFGCVIICLTLGSAETLMNQTEYSNAFYWTLSFVTSICIITSGSIAVGSVKRRTTCYLMLSMVLSTVSSLLTFTLTGIQAYVTAVWHQKTDDQITNYTFAALIIGCIAASSAFLMGLMTICLTCTEVGACGIASEVSPTDDTDDTDDEDPWQNPQKPKTSTNSKKPQSSEHDDIPLPLHGADW